MPDLEALYAEAHDLNRRADAARKLGDRPLAASLAAEAHGVCQEIRDLEEAMRGEPAYACSDRMCGAGDCPTCHPELRNSIA